MSDLIIGAAYRPVETDWFNLLAKYQSKGDNNHYLEPFIDYTSSIYSIHAFIEPIKKLEFGFKAAFKHSTERSPVFTATSNTNFFLLRSEYDVTASVVIGGEYRLLHQVEANDALSGYSVDAGYSIMDNIRLFVGYNFKGYKEQDLVDYTVWSKGPFIKLTAKFDESLLGL